MAGAGAGLAMRMQESQSRGMLEGGSAQSQGLLGSPGLHECLSLSPEVISRLNLFPFDVSQGGLFCWCFLRRHLWSSRGKASLAFPRVTAQGCSLAFVPAVLVWSLLG